MNVRPLSMSWFAFSVAAFFLMLGSSQRLCGQALAAPRFFKLHFQSLGATTAPVIPVGAQFADPEDAEEIDDEPSFLFEASLRFPIKLKGKTQLFGELGHKNEFVHGFYSSEERELESLELFQTDFSLILRHRFDPSWTLTQASSLSSRSTTALDMDRNAWKFSSLAMLEKKIPHGEIGLGTIISYDQRGSIFPVFKYQRSFERGWSLDLLLPAKALVIKDLPGNARLMGGFRGSNASHFVHPGEVEIDMPGGARYRRMNVHALVAYERLLTPWLGVSTELGVNVPLRSGLYDPADPTRVIHNLQSRVSPHLKVGLFLCLPESFLQRMGN